MRYRTASVIKIGMIVPSPARAVYYGAVERVQRLSPKIAERCELAAGAFAKIESRRSFPLMCGRWRYD